MATTRTPLPQGQRCELQYHVGSHCYLLFYREGQEPLAREAVAKWARNRDLAFSWADASAIGEALGYDDPDDEPADEPCDCDLCRSFPPPAAKPLSGFSQWCVATFWATTLAVPAVAVYWIGRFAWSVARGWM